MISLLFVGTSAALALHPLNPKIRFQTSIHDTVPIAATAGTGLGPYAAAGYRDGIIMMLKIADAHLAAPKKLLFDVPHEEGYTNKVRSLHMADDMLIVGRDDGNVTVWEMETYKMVANLAHANVSAPTAVTAVARKNRRVVSGGDDSTVKVWSVDENGMLTLKNTIENVDKVLAVAILDDNTIAISDWNLIVTREQYKVSILTNIALNVTTVESFFSTSPFLSLDFSPDGKYLATGAAPAKSIGIATVWKLQSSGISPKMKVYDQHSDAVVSVRWSPDGNYLVTGSSDHHVRVFNVFGDASSRGLKHSFRAPDMVTGASFFSPDSVVWTVRSGELKWQELGSSNRSLVADRLPLSEASHKGTDGDIADRIETPIGVIF
eukprot:GEMP01025095.1.p1 GENE.GEMP01025095.1~~GEMP01025095.1.p1  ORF type:complete len:398 (-),score=73.19 GEMP01025095.1:1233-2366(-)